MKVKELLEALGKCDPEADVIVAEDVTEAEEGSGFATTVDNDTPIEHAVRFLADGQVVLVIGREGVGDANQAVLETLEECEWDEERKVVHVPTNLWNPEARDCASEAELAEALTKVHRDALVRRMGPGAERLTGFDENDEAESVWDGIAGWDEQIVQIGLPK